MSELEVVLHDSDGNDHDLASQTVPEDVGPWSIEVMVNDLSLDIVANDDGTVYISVTPDRTRVSGASVVAVVDGVRRHSDKEVSMTVRLRQ